MADERHGWLDVEAAEKLLRGNFADPAVDSVVHPADDHARTDALRLAAALAEARAVRPADGELPGEAVVLAAFREASRARLREVTADRRSAATGPAATAGRTGRTVSLLTVRVGSGHTAQQRHPRWSRPLRYGWVASLAGCALGGVAVAASTGMISGPFSGHGSPVPTTSVSAAASPEERGSGLPSEEPSVSPPGPPATTGSAAPSGTPEDAESATGAGDARPSGPAGGSADTDTVAPDGNADMDGSTEATGSPGAPGDSTGAESRELYERTVRDCYDYRYASLDARRRRRLILMAKGEGNLDRFCDRLWDGAGQNGEGGVGNDRGDSYGGSGDGGDPPSDGMRVSLPSVFFDESLTAEAANGGAVPAAEGDVSSGPSDPSGSSDPSGPFASSGPSASAASAAHWEPSSTGSAALRGLSADLR